jgi:hypothetical protein
MKRLNKPFSAFGIRAETCFHGVPFGKNCRKTWSFDIHILSVGSSVIGNGFMVEGFSKTIRVIPIITFECLGKCVTFCFKDQSCSIVIKQQLKYSGGTIIGWNEQHFLCRLAGFLHIPSSLPFLRIVLDHFQFVLLFQLRSSLPEFFVNGFYQFLTKD